MSKALNKKINVFITVDLNTMNSYFNEHDPAPLYKRNLSHKFEEYILHSVMSAKRYSVIFYKMNCPGAVDKQYTEPLMYAIRRHFKMEQSKRVDEFNKFKKRTFILLALSIIMVVLCQWFLPMLISDKLSIHSGLKNLLDVFSWVILWKPINELIFFWNPHLKEISLLQKLASAEAIIIENESSLNVKLNQNGNMPGELTANKMTSRDDLIAV